MYLNPFHELYPDVAERETRVITILHHDDIPAGQYLLIEAYCLDPTCDCQRVMLNVIAVSGGRPEMLAAISYGFDREGEDAGPFIDPLNPRCRFAQALLKEVASILEIDPAYVDRLRRHYQMAKEAAEPGHPAHADWQRLQRGNLRPGPSSKTSKTRKRRRR